jgi:signal recognition particle subunit SRP68
MEIPTSSPPNITISPSEVSFLKSLLDGEVQRHRALVELSNLSSTPPSSNAKNTLPLIEKLSEYPASGTVNLQNLVTYPPKLEPVPVKPLFFDVAWNYIEYPGREIQEKVPEKVVDAASATAGTAAEQAAQQKRGWFGFGRT